MAAAPQYTPWTPAACPERAGWFHLVRREADAAGQPVGPAEVATSPGGFPRQFPSQERAQLACDWFNNGEGL